MCLFCVLILPNCPLFVCVLNLTFHISRQVSSINYDMFRKKIIDASSNLNRSLHLRTKVRSNRCLHIETEEVFIMERETVQLLSIHVIDLASFPPHMNNRYDSLVWKLTSAFLRG